MQQLQHPRHSTQIPLQDLDREVILDQLPIQGKLPEWLNGTLVRNGPAKFHFGSQQIKHWFDGLAMLHGFTFANGQISYRNKFLRSTAYSNAMEHQNLRFMGFAQDPCTSVFKRLFTYFIPSMAPSLIQNANVNVMRIAEKYVALTETPLPVVFDPTSLNTLGTLDFDDALLKENCFESAHPHHDPHKRETLNFQIQLGKTSKYVLYTIPDNGPSVRKPFFTMETDKASYMHTFALTERYVVLVEFSLILNPLELLLKGGGYITHFKWDPQRPARFHVIDRSSGTLKGCFETAAFFCFHHVNAYEDKNELVIDLIHYPDAQIVFGEPPPDQIRTLERYRLDLSNSKIRQETIAETALELPRIYYQKFNTRPYKNVYGVGFKYPSSPSDCIPILKIDVETGATKKWQEPGALAGEPVFIPHPEARGEDDGICLSVVTNEMKQCSYLLALDAKNMQEIARAEVSHLIPYGLHGMFFHL